jgi:hypothetical protein
LAARTPIQQNESKPPYFNSMTPYEISIAFKKAVNSFEEATKPLVDLGGILGIDPVALLITRANVELPPTDKMGMNLSMQAADRVLFGDVLMDASQDDEVLALSILSCASYIVGIQAPHLAKEYDRIGQAAANQIILAPQKCQCENCRKNRGEDGPADTSVKPHHN